MALLDGAVVQELCGGAWLSFLMVAVLSMGSSAVYRSVRDVMRCSQRYVILASECRPGHPFIYIFTFCGFVQYCSGGDRLSTYIRTVV